MYLFDCLFASFLSSCDGLSAWLFVGSLYCFSFQRMFIWPKNFIGDVNVFAFNDEPRVVIADILAKNAHDGVVLQEVGQGFVVKEVIDAHHLDVIDAAEDAKD